MTSGSDHRSSLDVDARFLLANERTLLAWVRTSLALMAGGLGIHRFGEDVAGNRGFAVVALLAGMVAAAAGALRHRRADASIREGALPPTGLSPYLLTGVVGLIGAALLVALLVG